MEPFLSFVIECLQAGNQMIKITNKKPIIAECYPLSSKFDKLTLKEILESWINHQAVTSNFTVIKLKGDQIIEYKGDRPLRKMINTDLSSTPYQFLTLTV